MEVKVDTCLAEAWTALQAYQCCRHREIFTEAAQLLEKRAEALRVLMGRGEPVVIDGTKQSYDGKEAHAATFVKYKEFQPATQKEVTTSWAESKCWLDVRASALDVVVRDEQGP